MKKVKLPDSVQIIHTTVNGFNDMIADDRAVVKGAFFEGTGEVKLGTTDTIVTYDAHCYLDETDEWILGHAYRLEGMYLIANLYGGLTNDSWYKIVNVKLGVTKLLDNVVNNCHVFLQKASPLELEERQ